ncbi:DUF1850 domain-containing protein [Peteryoungia desertarenae]|uniref:DUF1850 domain-containing protein n=1 Tax=Peteryoungia desertarenae TaxID=1813451 RepID=A0ABX6QM33_9HYPH|nr:DUF1850 domain-containing protein [Peteryoungia desertarenae]QLF69619.1 DUF1850 domain-containing protein [Peteryoungia desertarenae]
MSLCITVLSKTLLVPVMSFSLSWTHSVEKVEWREDWSVTPAGLELKTAYIKGSGAGMEPGEGAVLDDGWWRWKPRGAAIPELRLAASGATGGGWTLCHEGGCLPLGREAGSDSVLWPCDGPTSNQDTEQ